MRCISRASAKASLAQLNVRRPALFNSRKFHLRLHMIVASLVPLRAYLAGDGKLFTAAFPFTTDPTRFDDPGIHLTNWAAANRLRSAGREVPRVTSFLISEVLANGSIAGMAGRELWDAALDIAAKVAFSAQLHVGAKFERRVPGTCFDVFGIDVMFDADGNAWLLEVNNAPGIYDGTVNLSFDGPYLTNELLPGVLSTFAVARENEDSARATAFDSELRRCMVGLPFDGARLRMCPRDEGDGCITAEDKQALWLAFDELCTAEERGFKAAFPRPGARGFHIGPPPRIDRLLWMWQARCRGDLC